MTLLLFCAQGTKQDGMAMDVGWFETYHGLNNLGRNILKFIAQHATWMKFVNIWPPFKQEWLEV
jgi:hypothetical protein